MGRGWEGKRYAPTKMNWEECLERGLSIADYCGDCFEDCQLDFGDLPVTLEEILSDDEAVIRYYRLRERFWFETWVIQQR